MSPSAVARPPGRRAAIDGAVMAAIVVVAVPVLTPSGDEWPGSEGGGGESGGLVGGGLSEAGDGGG